MLLLHLGKMMVRIVKRLKDTDTVVRDACVEAVGVFASTVRSSSAVSGSGGGGESTFITIVKPLFEALGEQNRYVQSGSALCLTRVIDETNDPPIPVLSQMMPRVVKLLKNPHFMAKPAVIELIRSIVQVYTRNSVDSLLALQMTVHNLENAVNKISNTVSQNERHSSKITMNNQNVTCSPRVSITTPRPSMEFNFSSRQTSSLKDKSKEALYVNFSLKSRDITSAAKESVKLLREPRLNKVRNYLLPKVAIRGTQNDTICSRSRESNRNASSIKHDRLEVKYAFWKQMKELLHTGDIESAYAEALHRDDDVCLIELMNITGPVLERLSCETAAVILGILTTLFWKQRFTDSIIPWFLQN